MEISNENTRKIWILSIIGILSLILLTIGATYAYFTFTSDNQFGSQTIEATTEAIGSGVTLTKVGEPLTLDVSALEMLEENIGTSYYASGSSTPAQIGKIAVAGEGTFNCTYTMTVSATSTSEDKNLYTKFQNFEDKSEGQIYLDINESRYDFNTANLFPITYSGSVNKITSASDSYITANMTIVNNELDQTVLNDGDISLTFEVKEFDCELKTYTGPKNATELLASPNEGLNTTMEGGLYRYQGTNDTVNNYLCFGYSDAEKDCDFTNTTNSDLYAYRIIGINESGQLKLIKKEALNTAYKWHENATTNTLWSSSTLYNELNGNAFYTNDIYLSSDWMNKISTTSWKFGAVAYPTVNVPALSIYETENGWTRIVNAKIALLYIHDYVYSYSSGGLNCTYDYGAYTTCKNSWMHLSKNDLSAPASHEWLIAQYGQYDLQYRANIINSEGYVSFPPLTENLSTRPVFYLNSEVQFIDGTGTSSNPFIIS